MGKGFRTNPEGLRQLGEALDGLGVEIVPVELPYFYGPEACLHLMSLLSLVDHDLAVAYPYLIPVPFWRFLRVPARSGIELVRRTMASVAQWFSIPEGLYYHQGHSWIMPQGAELVKVGVDDFAQKLVGRSNRINLPKVGSRIEQGDVGWKLGIDAKTIDMLSPVTGDVVAVNKDIVKNPDLVNQDPYGKGWLMMVKPDNQRVADFSIHAVILAHNDVIPCFQIDLSHIRIFTQQGPGSIAIELYLFDRGCEYIRHPIFGKDFLQVRQDIRANGHHAEDLAFGQMVLVIGDPLSERCG